MRHSGYIFLLLGLVLNRVSGVDWGIAASYDLDMVVDKDDSDFEQKFMAGYLNAMADNNIRAELTNMNDLVRYKDGNMVTDRGGGRRLRMSSKALFEHDEEERRRLQTCTCCEGLCPCTCCGKEGHPTCIHACSTCRRRGRDRGRVLVTALASASNTQKTNAASRFETLMKEYVKGKCGKNARCIKYVDSTQLTEVNL